MANRALSRPSLPGPRPVPTSKAVGETATRRSVLLHSSSGETADRLFSFAMLACAAGILGLLALIVYELIVRSQLSWHAFGWSFFVAHDWDPVNEQFGALPFIYGTIISSLL